MLAVMALPAQRYQPGRTAWKIVNGSITHHYNEHGDQIRVWSKSRAI